MAQPNPELQPRPGLTLVQGERTIVTDELEQRRKMHAIGAVAFNNYKIYEEIVIRGGGQAAAEEFPAELDNIPTRPHIGLSSPYVL